MELQVKIKYLKYAYSLILFHMLPTGEIFNKATMKGIFCIAYLIGLEGNLTFFLIKLQTHF